MTPRTTQAQARQRRLLIDSLLLGVAGAVAAVLFNALLHLAQDLLLTRMAGYRPPGLPAEGGTLGETVGPHGLWPIPIVTTFGGLLAGALVYGFAPEAEGHGTDAVIRAFHRAAGVVRARVPIVKLLASAITIGSGGAAGREGPVALITAGIGSLYARLRKRSEADTRLLLLIGMAAGLAAIFRSPVGTALMSVEVMYVNMEFESGALLFSTLSSVVAYALSGIVLGWQPLFHVPGTLAAPAVSQYPWYAALGIAGGLVATALPVLFYRTRDIFHAIPIPRWLKPALGGLTVGLLALGVREILGGGYGWMQEAIDGRLTLAVLALLLVTKPIALSLTVASGGSGGVFAPTLFVGTMLGGTFAALFGQPPAPFAVVGMAAVFAGAAHVPFATLMMVIEMTGGYTLLVPAALTVSLSYLVHQALAHRVKYPSLYESQVGGRADSPAHHAEHLRIALDILRQHDQPLPPDVGRLDLVSLLQCGIPVDLPDRRRLMIGVLRDGSDLVGHPPNGERRIGPNTEIVAILRGERMLAPRPDAPLEVGDRLILLSAPADWPTLKPQLHIGWS
ncbi:MAG: chloride channel protein [Gemmatimonadetes bacterium]|nr:chloride channel protein [Gemmatimonadota bacterium]